MKHTLLYECCKAIDLIDSDRRWGFTNNQVTEYVETENTVEIKRDSIKKYTDQFRKLELTTFDKLAKITWFKNKGWTEDCFKDAKDEEYRQIFTLFLDEMLMEVIRCKIDEQFQGIKVRFIYDNIDDLINEIII